MCQQNYSGRSPTQRKLLVVLGQQASAAYDDGERDETILVGLGVLKRRQFDSIEEMNAYIEGVEDATGYMAHTMIEV